MNTSLPCKASDLWPHLPAPLACELDEISQPKDFKKGDFLYQAGDPPKGLFFVFRGLVGLVNYGENGSEHILRLFGKGSCLGHRSLIANENYHASAKVLEDSRIGWVDAQSSQKLLMNNQNFALLMLKKMAKELRFAEERLSGNTDKQVAHRVAEALVFLKDSFPDHKWTRSEIAHYCGTTTATVIRTLAEFEKQGWIEQRGRDIFISDKSALTPNSYEF